MNRKAFTLIELLTVIAIIAIVALITVPVVTNVISLSEKNSFARSVEQLKNVVDMDYNEYARSGEVVYKYQDNELICLKCNNDSDLKLDFTGKIKDGFGTIKNNEGEITLDIENSNYKASNVNDKVVVTKK